MIVKAQGQYRSVGLVTKRAAPITIVISQRATMAEEGECQNRGSRRNDVVMVDVSEVTARVRLIKMTAEPMTTNFRLSKGVEAGYFYWWVFAE